MDKPEGRSDEARHRVHNARVDSIVRSLNEAEAARYRILCEKKSLVPAEADERAKLERLAHARKEVAERFQLRRSSLQAISKKLHDDPGNLELQRLWLRETVAICYPSFPALKTEMALRGEYVPKDIPIARQALEAILHVADFTPIEQTLQDPDQRKTFLSNLAAMLEPFRQRRSPKSNNLIDLHEAFGFTGKGSGNRSDDSRVLERDYWDAACFDLHILRLSGVKITPALARVAAQYSEASDTLRKRYAAWAKHPVRKQWLPSGDDIAKEFLSSPHCQELLKTAFPILPRAPRPHRP